MSDKNNCEDVAVGGYVVQFSPGRFHFGVEFECGFTEDEAIRGLERLRRVMIEHFDEIAGAAFGDGDVVTPARMN